MPNSDAPLYMTVDQSTLLLQQIERTSKAIEKLTKLYIEVKATVMNSAHQDQHKERRVRNIIAHSSQLTDALDLECLAGIDQCIVYGLDRPSCSSLDLEASPKL